MNRERPIAKAVVVMHKVFGGEIVNRMFQRGMKGCGQALQLKTDQRGQGLLEWTVTLPLFLVLCVGIAFYAWTWWNQVTAAAAIHDGVYAAAVKGGNLSAGYGRVQEMLGASVGNFSRGYTVQLSRTGGTRSVYGELSNPDAVQLPFLGRMLFGIRASSFQRAERFYGGPPQGWW